MVISTCTSDCQHTNLARKRKRSESGLIPTSQEAFVELAADKENPHSLDPKLSQYPQHAGKPLARCAPSSQRIPKSNASVHDSNYRATLRCYGIFIEEEDPSTEFFQRAKRVVFRQRPFEALDEDEIGDVKRKSRKMADAAEDMIVKIMAPLLIPAMIRMPSPCLEMNSDQLWARAVPLPLRPNLSQRPLSLPLPKPDLAFGYSKDAFTEKQLITMEQLLTAGSSGRSFAMPDQTLRFPFLTIEFKAQARRGTILVARNQAAGAGAIAMNSKNELMRRSLGAEEFDHDEPYFFSVAIDNMQAVVNVHWTKTAKDGADSSFHLENISHHFLTQADGIQSFVWAIKNILEYHTSTQLPRLRVALDAYRERFLQAKNMANEHETISAQSTTLE